MQLHIRGLMAALALAAAGTEAQALDLNGDWTLDYFPQPDDGAVRALPLTDGLGVKRVAATVPGNCELDLVRAGILPEPEIGLNALKLLPYEGYQWLYAKTFAKPALAKGERAVLRFEGIDTLADIFLNGEKIGETANMLIPHTFDVTKRLREGENTVQVLIRSVRCEAQYATLGELGYSMGGGADGEPFRKAGHMGGWDIFPRIYCAGLWRGVALDVEKPVRIDQTAWIVRDLGKDWANLNVHCRVQAPYRVLHNATLRLTLARDGKVVAERAQILDRYQNCTPYWRIGGIERWWPKGMGMQPLYDAKIEVVATDGTVLAAHTEKIGLRTIRLERDDVYSKERPGQFLFRVNGEPCYVRGSNWVPLDSFHGRDGQFIRSTLEMFDELNCNMVRVWGGGVYEPDEFFDFCDAHGIMVWQDFMTGCSVFPQNDAYAKATEEEIRTIVLKYRNRASLAIWSGNNENDNAFSWKLSKGLKRDPNLDRNSRRTIPDVLYEFDVTRDYLPSSPYEPSDVFWGRAKPSELHLWGARAYYKVPFYTNSPAWFASEMGYHGCPNLESLRRMMTPPNLYPWKAITGTDPKKDYVWNDEWSFKASDPRIGDFGQRRNSLMTNQTKIMFGGVCTNLETFVEQSQFVQAEAMKTFCEVFRSRKFARFNGLIWWNVRDGWPQISDAVVDYWGGKKRAYWALKSVQRNQLCMLGDDHVAWAVNDRRYPVKGHVRYFDRTLGKVLLERDYEVAANARARLGEIPFSGQGWIDIDYSCDGEDLKNHFLYGEPPFDWTQVKAWSEGSDRPDDLAAFVEPFTGTAGTGHTHPAACVPFGMVQAGPDTGSDNWAYCSGYQYRDASVLGYSQTHLSGTGCPDYGDIQILPFTGELGKMPARRAIDKTSERASPGRYFVRQPDDNLTVEITAAKRAALYRIAGGKGGAVRVLVNLPFGLGRPYPRGKVPPSVKTSDAVCRLDGKRKLSGDHWRTGWISQRRIGYAIAFDRDWTKAERIPGTLGTSDEAPRYVLTFPATEKPLLAKVAFSTVNGDAAERNLAADLPGWDFDRVAAAARARWNELFARSTCDGDDTMCRNWYTALYHLYSQPNDYADADGRYRGADNKVAKGEDGTYFTTLSLWDTFRASQPWYTLATPEVVEPVIRSFLAHYRAFGRLPVMSYGGKNVDCMVGNHSVPVIADAYLKGFRNFDIALACEAIVNTLDKPHPGKPKENWDLYDRHGYFPCDAIRGESVSRTLECSYDDACAAAFLKAAGRAEDAAFFAKRAANWKNVFDSSVGFGRGKTAAGTWREPFDPYCFGHGAENNNDFTEGNAFQYSWHVMQDVPGLVEAMGGRAKTLAQLDKLFTASALGPDTQNGTVLLDISGMIGQYVHGNEPSHHVIYFYPQLGARDRAAERIREVFDTQYHTGPEGLCGNDDCGQMSAWYVFSAMGFYPFDPCGGDYILGAPQVPKATLKLANGRSFTVVAKNFSKENRYVKAVTLNGRPLEGAVLRHADILAGGELVFEMALRPAR